MSLSTFAICFLLMCLQSGSYGTECRISKPDSELSRLKEHLTCGYDSSTAPQVSQNSSTPVNLYLVLRRFSLIEEYDRIEVYYGAAVEWKDVRLKWDPSDFGNIKQFYIYSSLIWTPQIGWDTDSDSLFLGTVPCLLHSNGRAMCISWSSFRTTCRSDLTHWPYDSNVCEAQLAPWRLTHKELELLVQDTAMFQLYESNRKWAILDAVMEHRSDVFENSSFNYATMILTLTRQSATHEATVVVPALVLTVLTLASSWIEAESSTRLSLLCSLVVCHILFLQYMSLSLFNNGISCPLIVLFYRDSMLVCGLSLAVTLVVRWMVWNRAVPPAWASGIALKVQESRPGQLLGLLFLQHSRQVADREGDETPSRVGPNWRLVGTVLDRISFLVYSVIYFVLLIKYYLYYL